MCLPANWGQEHWNIVAEAHKIQENSEERDEKARVTIYHLFDSAELNGWVRPWRINKQKGPDDLLSPEEAAEMRAFRRLRVQEWMEARASQFTLADAFHPALAALLKTRADAFPVSEIAMLPAFMAASAAMLGTRYRVEVKPGYTEPMVIWVGSVGAASTLKTPVAQQMLRPLLNQDKEIQLAYKEKLRHKAGG